MATNDFVAGPEFTVADITAHFTVRMTNVVEMDIASTHPATAAWFAKISERPAFQL
jgi:glutathione S-transferase